MSIPQQVTLRDNQKKEKETRNKSGNPKYRIINHTLVNVIVNTLMTSLHLYYLWKHSNAKTHVTKCTICKFLDIKKKKYFLVE